MYLDLTARRHRKSIILFKDGHVAASPFSVKTLYNRLRKAVSDEIILDSRSEREIAEVLTEEEEDAMDETDTVEEDEEYEDLDADKV